MFLFFRVIQVCQEKMVPQDWKWVLYYYYYYYYYYFNSMQFLSLLFFYSSLSNKSPPTDFSSAVVWIVSILPLISISFIFPRFLGTVLRSPTKIGNWDFSFLPNYQRITFTTQSWLSLYCFFASFLRLLNVSWGECDDLLGLKDISTKLGVDLYDRTKIQTLTTGWPFCGKDLDFNPAV